MSEVRAVIVAAASAEQLTGFAARPDLVVAADSGLHAVLDHGWVPDRLVGDLDSATIEAIDEAQRRGVPVDRHPESKNETDLELAIATAVAAGATDVHVVVRSDGRLDHQLANLVVLASPEWATVTVSASVGEHSVWVVRGRRSIEADIGQQLAIVPVGGPASVTSSGVAYPLDREVLSPFVGRGIANEVTASTVDIEIDEGVVLVLSSPA